MGRDSSTGTGIVAGPGNQLVIGEGVQIVGSIKAPGVVHLHGRLEGDLIANELQLAATGELVGTVVAELVEVHGKARHKITGSRSVTIRRTALVEGEIAYAELEIEAGAQIEGTLQRLSGTGRTGADS